MYVFMFVYVERRVVVHIPFLPLFAYRLSFLPFSSLIPANGQTSLTLLYSFPP